LPLNYPFAFSFVGPDSDSSRNVATNKDGGIKKISSSTSTCSGIDDIKSKEHLSLTDVKKGKTSPLWLTDSVIKENFLKMADQASDFDESVWKSIKLTLCQKAYKSLSAKYKPNFNSTVPQFEDSYSSSQAESLRWEFMMADASEEMERLRVYKINRRKRFLAERHAKGLELTSSSLCSNSQTDAIQQMMATTYLDIDDGSVLSHIIDPLGFNGADDSREMLLNCS
jgi:hypothetical protein